MASFLHIAFNFVGVNVSEPILLIQDSDADHWVNTGLPCASIEMVRNLHRPLLIDPWLKLHYLTVDLMPLTIDLIGLRETSGG